MLCLEINMWIFFLLLFLFHLLYLRCYFAILPQICFKNMQKVVIKGMPAVSLYPYVVYPYT
jgi:hypothetical protein